MEQYIPASLLNDFIYSPESIYLHSIYSDFDKSIYQDLPQINGTLNHQSIDQATYTTVKNTLQGVMFFCEQYNLCGRIDLYNTKTGVLTERKSLIKHIHIGYRYQLYAEMFGLLELGYKVNKLQLHSLQDNKKYPIPLPNQQRIQEFTSTIQDLQNFDPISILQNNHTSPNTNISIYQNLSF